MMPMVKALTDDQLTGLAKHFAALAPKASYERIYFLFKDTATTEIYTLSLHDALPISTGDGLAVQERDDDGDRLDAKRRRQLRSEEHTSELQSRENLVCRLLLEKKKTKQIPTFAEKKNTSKKKK